MDLSLNRTTLQRAIRTGVKKVKKADFTKILRQSKLVRRLMGRPLAAVSEDAMTLFAMIQDVTKGDYRDVPRTTVVMAAFALLYAINPFDLIPDFVPGIGYLDDVSVMMLVLQSIATDLEDYRLWARKRRSIGRRIKNTVKGIKRRIAKPIQAEA